MVRALRAAGPHPTFVADAAVQFHVPAGPVRAVVVGLDAQARQAMPQGLPYRLRIRQAPAGCGYDVGREYTIRAACLELDPDAAQPVPTLAPAAPAAPARPMFLVAFLREGGTVPVQGSVLVMAETLEAASAAAMAQLTAELEADVRERGESPEAMVLLLNAAEVPPPPASSGGATVLASVTW
ncbi:MAG: hypothetical protein K2R93_15895 [Gemmatimonadaceae bacterium]|nr:hypothetical protein [Gemmatimonadaceae bacterium]